VCDGVSTCAIRSFVVAISAASTFRRSARSAVHPSASMAMAILRSLFSSVQVLLPAATLGLDVGGSVGSQLGVMLPFRSDPLAVTSPELNEIRSCGNVTFRRLGAWFIPEMD
jgi:hypothetical protein